MKQKKMTKRQVLDGLLAIEEERKKIKIVEERLDRREQRYIDKREKLSKQLADILREEQKKNGEDTWRAPDPVLYKNHTFAPSSGGRYDHPKCEIRRVKGVK
jgi:hypothetical protein